MEVPFLANIKSSEKDIRSPRLAVSNQAVRSEVRTHIRRFKAANSGDETRKVRLYRVAQKASIKQSAREYLRPTPAPGTSPG